MVHAGVFLQVRAVVHECLHPDDVAPSDGHTGVFHTQEQQAEQNVELLEGRKKGRARQKTRQKTRAT